MPRYVVKPQQIDGIKLYGVWDTLAEAFIFKTGMYYTERFAQEDADKLNAAAAAEGGENTMLKEVLTGEPVKVEDGMIVMQEGEAIASYNQKYFRLVSELPQPEQSQTQGWVEWLCDADMRTKMGLLGEHVNLLTLEAATAAYRLH